MSDNYEKYKWCAVGKCKKNRRLDNRPKSQYSQVFSEVVLDKLRMLHKDVMMGDFVCVGCRYQANKLFSKLKHGENRKSQDITDITFN